MLNDGLFGVSVMSQRKRRFTRQFFAQTDEFGVHFLMTSQYAHLISRGTNCESGTKVVLIHQQNPEIAIHISTNELHWKSRDYGNQSVIS